MQRFLTYLFVLTGLLACSGAVGATGMPDSLEFHFPSDTLTLDDCIFIVQRPEREILPAQKLDGKQLEALNVHSVADAIRWFSGVQLKDFGGIGGLKTVNVRSMGSHHTGVFYDGIEIGNAQNGIIDLGRFSLDNMESVTLTNGQKSAVLQSAKDYASASTIYLRTRRPVFESTEKYHFNIGLKGGSFKTINPSFLWEQKISRNITSSLSTEFLYTSGEYKFRYRKQDGYDTTAVRKNGDVRMLRAEAAFFGQIEDGSWEAKAYFYDSERGFPGAAVREKPGLFKHQDRQWDRNFFTQAHFRKRFSPLYSLQVQGKYSLDRLHYLSDPRLDVTTLYIDRRWRQQEGYFSQAHLLEIFPCWSLSLANDLQYNHLESDMKEFARPRRATVQTALATDLDFGFLQLQASLLHTFIHDRTLNPVWSEGTMKKLQRNHQAFSPSLILSARPWASQDFRIRAFYKQSFRMPTLNDLYYTEVGNADLKPERSRQYDFGLSYHRDFNGWFRQVDLQADAYFNQIDNKIIATPASNQFRWSMLNIGYVEIWGTEASLQANFRFGPVELSPRLTYTFQQASDLTDPESEWYGGQIPYIPRHSGSVLLNLGWKGWSLNYSFIYTGERYESVANIPVNRAQPWYTSDLSLSKCFTFKKFQFKATAEVNNLFNQQYEVVQCYPMPGTNFNMKINFLL